MLLSHRPNYIQRVKVGVIPIPLTELDTLKLLRIEPTAVRLELSGVALVLIRQHSAGDRAEHVKRDAVVAETFEQLRLGAAMESVVNALIDVGRLPAVART